MSFAEGSALNNFLDKLELQVSNAVKTAREQFKSSIASVEEVTIRRRLQHAFDDRVVRYQKHRTEQYKIFVKAVLRIILRNLKGSKKLQTSSLNGVASTNLNRDCVSNQNVTPRSTRNGGQIKYLVDCESEGGKITTPRAMSNILSSTPIDSSSSIGPNKMPSKEMFDLVTLPTLEDVGIEDFISSLSEKCFEKMLQCVESSDSNVIPNSEINSYNTEDEGNEQKLRPILKDVLEQMCKNRLETSKDSFEESSRNVCESLESISQNFDLVRSCTSDIKRNKDLEAAIDISRTEVLMLFRQSLALQKMNQEIMEKINALKYITNLRNGDSFFLGGNDKQGIKADSRDINQMSEFVMPKTLQFLHASTTQFDSNSKKFPRDKECVLKSSNYDDEVKMSEMSISKSREETLMTIESMIKTLMRDRSQATGVLKSLLMLNKEHMNETNSNDIQNNKNALFDKDQKVNQFEAENDSHHSLNSRRRTVTVDQLPIVDGNTEFECDQLNIQSKGRPGRKTVAAVSFSQKILSKSKVEKLAFGYLNK